jgi:aminocarboxymuconate-semialdehyde decarboxylase
VQRGAFFTGALAAAAARRGVIDCQSHLFVPELISWMEKRRTSPYVHRKDGGTYIVVNDWVRRLQPRHTDVAAKIADMDAAGIAMTALSINDPGPELFGSDGMAVASMCHDFIAEASKQHPGRFFGLMTLPLQDINAALKEADRRAAKLANSNLQGSRSPKRLWSSSET